MRSIRLFIKSLARLVPRPASVIDYLMFSVRQRSTKAYPSARVDDVCKEIQKNGFVVIKDFMSKSDCEKIIGDFFDAKKRFPESCKVGSDERIYGIEEYSKKAYSFYSDPFLKSISDSYCGELTANAFTMFNEVLSKPDSLGSGEGWHKDSSFRQIKTFLYLADVDENDGPFQLLAKSHKLLGYLKHIRLGNMQFRELRISSSQMEKILKKEGDQLKTFTGKAGTLIIADTAAIHRGKPPNGGKHTFNKLLRKA